VFDGGTLDDDNLVTACKSCNSSKGTSGYDAFKLRMQPVLLERMWRSIEREIIDYADKRGHVVVAARLENLATELRNS
jgi:hypothetical protein